MGREGWALADAEHNCAQNKPYWTKQQRKSVYKAALREVAIMSLGANAKRRNNAMFPDFVDTRYASHRCQQTCAVKSAVRRVFTVFLPSRSFSGTCTCDPTAA